MVHAAKEILLSRRSNAVHYERIALGTQSADPAAKLRERRKLDNYFIYFMV
jgi:hypothetical protein